MITKQRKLIKIEDELWRVIPNSNNRYLISNYGRVKSLAYDQEDGQILKNQLVRGFKTVHLQLNNTKRETFYLHKLVAEIWIPKPSDDHKFVGHKDGNKKNNRVSNLFWMTKEILKEHHRELYLTKGFGRPKNQINNNKLKISDVKLLKAMLQRGTPQIKIAEMFCISEMQVTRIKRGENWSHIII